MRIPLRHALQLGGVGAASLLAFGMSARPSIAADEVAAGQALYQAKCTGCHSVDANRIGPRHRDVVGRKVASVSGSEPDSSSPRLDVRRGFRLALKTRAR